MSLSSERFAAHVLRELQELGALSQQGESTTRGRELLEVDSLDGREVVSGYVFQDPWTRELWPRMVVREEPQAVEYPVTPRPDSVQQSRRARRNTLEPSAQEELSLGSPSYAPLIDRTSLIETAPRAVVSVHRLRPEVQAERWS